MSGGISGFVGNIGSLFSASASGAASNSTTAILSAAYAGLSGGVSGVSSGNPILALQIAQRNQVRDIKAESQQPAVQRNIAAFVKAVQTAKTPAQLLSNPIALNVLLTANGLGSEAAYPALAKKALLSDPADPKGLANQLAGSNGQWLATARTYQFATKGLAVIQDPKAISTITNGYAEVLWRQSLDKQTPGLSNALYAIQNAKNFTSAVQILGDSVMRSVVTTALGIPQQLAYQPLAAQEQAITSRLTIADFQKPQFVQSFTDRYLAVLQASTRASTGSASLSSLAVQAEGFTA